MCTCSFECLAHLKETCRFQHDRNLNFENCDPWNLCKSFYEKVTSLLVYFLVSYGYLVLVVLQIICYCSVSTSIPNGVYG